MAESVANEFAEYSTAKIVAKLNGAVVLNTIEYLLR